MTSILIIIAFNLILYFPTLKYGYVMDDEQWIDGIKDGFFKNKRGIEFIKLRLYGAGTFGLNKEIDHAFTLMLHTLICVLIYIGLGYNHISFGGAMLYACNPINHQTSMWLNGRRYAINIILILLMIISNQQGFLGKLLAMGIYLFTGLFQVTAIFSPIILGILPSIVMVIFSLLFHQQIKDKIIDRERNMADGDQKKFHPSRIIVIVKSFGFYFGRMLTPGICATIYPNLFWWGKTKEGNKDAYKIDRDFIIGIFYILCFIPVFLLLHGNYRCWEIFTFLAIMQWCNIIPVLQVLADRYISLANVFMMFFLSYFINTILPQDGWMILMLIGAYYCLGLSVVMPMYKNIVSFYNYHIEYFPKMPWPRTIYIESLMMTGNIEEAEIMTRQGLMANYHDFTLLRNGAMFCLFRGYYDNGMIFLDEAERNLYLGQEEDQLQQIKNLREQFNKSRKQ